MTELGRRWAAGLVVAAGVCIASVSTAAESIGLGSGNGSFGTWQMSGVGTGLVVILIGALWFSPPERWVDREPLHLPTELFKPRAQDAMVVVYAVVVVAELWIFARWPLAGWVALTIGGSVLVTELLRPEDPLPRSVRNALIGAVVVAAVALTWNVSDDWGLRCGPDHPAYRNSLEWGPSCAPLDSGGGGL